MVLRSLFGMIWNSGQDISGLAERPSAAAAARGRSAEAEHRGILRPSLLGSEEDFAARVEALRLGCAPPLTAARLFAPTVTGMGKSDGPCRRHQCHREVAGGGGTLRRCAVLPKHARISISVEPHQNVVYTAPWKIRGGEKSVITLAHLQNFASKTLRRGPFVTTIHANVSCKSNILDAFRHFHQR